MLSSPLCAYRVSGISSTTPSLTTGRGSVRARVELGRGRTRGRHRRGGWQDLTGQRRPVVRVLLVERRWQRVVAGAEERLVGLPELGDELAVLGQDVRGASFGPDPHRVVLVVGR